MPKKYQPETERFLHVITPNSPYLYQERLVDAIGKAEPDSFLLHTHAMRTGKKCTKCSEEPTAKQLVTLRFLGRFLSLPLSRSLAASGGGGCGHFQGNPGLIRGVRLLSVRCEEPGGFFCRGPLRVIFSSRADGRPKNSCSFPGRSELS